MKLIVLTEEAAQQILDAVNRIRDLCAAYDVTICDTAGTVIANETDTILELLR
jgi:hypothetical protein